LIEPRETAMTIELEARDVEVLLEGLDYVKTRLAFKKGGGSYEEKTARIRELDVLEQKLRDALVSK
jgi:hypothetical protein